MPDIGWMELLVIGVVALIVVGPKDLPIMFRKLGQFTGKLRGMAKDFQRAMDEAADESGMSELNRDLRKAAQFTKNPGKAGFDAINEAFGDLDDLDPEKYPEGSHTRIIAEKKVAAKADLQRRTEEARAARAAKLSDIDEAADDLAQEAAAAAEAKAAPMTPAPKAAKSAAPEPAATAKPAAKAASKPAPKPAAKPAPKSAAAEPAAPAATPAAPTAAAPADDAAAAPRTGTEGS